MLGVARADAVDDGHALRRGALAASKTHSSAFVRLLCFFVLVTILPPVGPEALVSRSNSSAVSTLGSTP